MGRNNIYTVLMGTNSTGCTEWERDFDPATEQPYPSRSEWADFLKSHQEHTPMGRNNIYTVLSGTSENWTVVKMDRDFEAENTYFISKHVSVCSCFAGNKSTCRHRQMLKIFQDAKAVDSRRAYNFDKNQWIDPPKAAQDSDF